MTPLSRIFPMPRAPRRLAATGIGLALFACGPALAQAQPAPAPAPTGSANAAAVPQRPPATHRKTRLVHPAKPVVPSKPQGAVTTLR